MADHILETRKAIVALLRADAVVTAIVPAARNYGEQVPANPSWPFTMCGLPTETSAPSNCIDSTDLSVVVHGFARGPGMDAASALGNAIKRALNGKRSVRGELCIDFVHEQNQIIRDTAESSDYHSISRFRAAVAEYK